MAKPHKHAGLSLQATTMLDPAHIASLALAAAEEAATVVPQMSDVRLESSEAGLLTFSVRGMFMEHLLFHLAVTATSSVTYMTTTIVRYKTDSVKMFPMIPISPRWMKGLPAYRKWIRCFSRRLKAADPAASVTVSS